MQAVWFLLVFSFSSVLGVEYASWRLLTPSGTPPAPRIDHKVAAEGQSFIIYGGWNAIQGQDHFYDDIWRLNITTDPSKLQWENLKGDNSISNLARADHGISINQGKAYIFGGEASDFTLPNNFLMYDLAQQKWTEVLASSPLQGRLGHSTVFNKKQAFIFGGTEADGTVLNELWTYYFDNKTWVQLKPSGTLPPVRMWHSAAMVNDDVFIIYGGNSWQGAKTYYGDMWAYSVSTNSWKQIQSNFPTGVGTRTGGAAVGCNSKMYIFAGAIEQENCANNFWVYDLKSNMWSTVIAKGSQQPPEGYCSTKGVVIQQDSNYYYLIFGGCTNSCLKVVGDLWVAQIQC